MGAAVCQSPVSTAGKTGWRCASAAAAAGSCSWCRSCSCSRWLVGLASVAAAADVVVARNCRWGCWCLSIWPSFFLTSSLGAGHWIGGGGGGGVEKRERLERVCIRMREIDREREKKKE